MRIFIFSFISTSPGDQDVNPGCDSFSALLGSKVIISSDCNLSSSLISSGSSWRPCSRWGSCSSLLPSTGSGCCHNIFYVMNLFIYRVVVFLFPFIQAIGQVIYIIKTLLNKHDFSSVNPLIYVAMSKLFRNSLFKIMKELCCKMENQMESTIKQENR